MKYKNVLITDLDNTLYDWFNIWHESFSAMVDEVIKITDIDRELLLGQIKTVHQKHGTAEYAFLLEEIPAIQEYFGGTQNILTELDSAIHAFNKARKKNLVLYPTVEKTLESLSKKGVCILGYTESKSYYSAYRIKKLGLDKYIKILYSPPDHHVPEGKAENTKFEFVYTQHKHTPLGELKPNPQLLRDIIREVGAAPEQCVYVGDSEMKDIAMAQQAEVTDVFASYGNGHFDENEDGYNLLRKVTHWTEEDVLREQEIKQNAGTVNPTYSINSFSELLNLFEFRSF